MLKSLRSRLLLSYIVIIMIALTLLAVALLAIAAVTNRAQDVPAIRELNAISINLRREVNRLQDTGVGQDPVLTLVADIATEQGVRVLLVEQNNKRVLADTNQAQSWAGESVADIRPLPASLQTDDDRLTGRFVDQNDGEWLALVQPLGGTNDGHALVIMRPVQSNFDFFLETFFGPLFIAGILAFLIALFLAYFISRSVAKPLQTMAAAAEAIANGDYKQQVEPKGPREVKQVAASFNTMAAEVELSRQMQREFVANVSHDLKTPLTSIRGWSQAMVDGTVDMNEAQSKAAGIIHHEAERMSRMVQQLLDLARIDAGQLTLNRTQVDLRQLLARVKQNLTLRAEEKQVFLTAELPAVPPVLGDYDWLMQVFTNLADNGLAHTPAGGRVHIECRLIREQVVQVTVQDTGAGIPPENLKRIFERFYQVDKSRLRTAEKRGTGLGLAIVNELVTAHGGRIEARSHLGEGSAFIVKLPVGPPAGTTVMKRKKRRP